MRNIGISVKQNDVQILGCRGYSLYDRGTLPAITLALPLRPEKYESVRKSAVYGLSERFGDE